MAFSLSTRFFYIKKILRNLRKALKPLSTILNLIRKLLKNVMSLVMLLKLQKLPMKISLSRYKQSLLYNKKTLPR
jgi:hypothetical protein